jgi:hypothetical protein
MKRFLISLGVGFLVALCGFIHETLPIYLDFLAHQPGKVPTNQVDAFPPDSAFNGISSMDTTLVLCDCDRLDGLDARETGRRKIETACSTSNRISPLHRIPSHVVCYE